MLEVNKYAEFENKITQETIKRLPSPYDTNCFDYEEKLRINGNADSKIQCLAECAETFLNNKHSCIRLNLIY